MIPTEKEYFRRTWPSSQSVLVVWRTILGNKQRQRRHGSQRCHSHHAEGAEVVRSCLAPLDTKGCHGAMASKLAVSLSQFFVLPAPDSWSVSDASNWPNLDCLRLPEQQGVLWKRIPLHIHRERLCFSPEPKRCPKHRMKWWRWFGKQQRKQRQPEKTNCNTGSPPAKFSKQGLFPGIIVKVTWVITN